MTRHAMHTGLSVRVLRGLSVAALAASVVASSGLPLSALDRVRADPAAAAVITRAYKDQWRLAERVSADIRSRVTREWMERAPGLGYPLAVTFAVDGFLSAGVEPEDCERALYDALDWSIASIPLLAIGSAAFDGATTTPGSGGHQAIARWTTPDRLYVGSSTVKYLGVSAWHIGGAGTATGIASVSFGARKPGGSNNTNGSWASAAEVTLNPDSLIWGHNVKIDGAPASLAGSVNVAEVRAAVTTSDGSLGRVLSINVCFDRDNVLNAGPYYISPSGNDSTGDGSNANPWKTPQKVQAALTAAQRDNALVYLKAGTYTDFFNSWGGGEYGLAGRTWFVFECAPDASPDTVILAGTLSTNAICTDYVCLRRLTLKMQIVTWNGQGATRAVWLDRVKCIGTGRTDPQIWTQTGDYPGGMYATGCTAQSCRDGLRQYAMNVNYTASTIGADATFDTPCLVNIQASGIDPTAGGLEGGTGPGPAYHSNLHQIASAVDNQVFINARSFDNGGSGTYGVHGIFVRAGGNIAGLACVNVIHESPEACGVFSELVLESTYTIGHVLLWNVTLPDAKMVLSIIGGGSNSNCTGLSIRHSYFSALALSGGFSLSGHDVDRNRFGSASTSGTNAVGSVTLAAAFTAPASNNYSAKAGGPLDGVVTGNAIGFDAAGLRRRATTSVGAMAATDETLPRIASALVTAAGTQLRLTWDMEVGAYIPAAYPQVVVGSRSLTLTSTSSGGDPLGTDLTLTVHAIPVVYQSDSGLAVLLPAGVVNAGGLNNAALTLPGFTPVTNQSTQTAAPVTGSRSMVMTAAVAMLAQDDTQRSRR